ncbi:hypothetical protein EVAR_21989_1 [Eumeta japonica]|uniref:Uncharacterized protein n=1 Tax=Eumeta variegata TaxID=151549 RepID=A0A4C1VVD6_EUMVA|nr:hypothetical protein EVAR_21989_1 [Eumeta japonica]
MSPRLHKSSLAPRAPPPAARPPEFMSSRSQGASKAGRKNYRCITPGFCLSENRAGVLFALSSTIQRKFDKFCFPLTEKKDY